jgi:hypothetical protein
MAHNSGTVNVKYTVIELNLYSVVHSTVLVLKDVDELNFKYHTET